MLTSSTFEEPYSVDYDEYFVFVKTKKITVKEKLNSKS